MRFDIRYRMAFDYDSPISESQNEIRVRPLDAEHQRVISYRLSTDPAGRQLSMRDYWGTTVDHVGYRPWHQSFEVVAEAAVETSARRAVDEDPPLTALADEAWRLSSLEYLESSDMAAIDDVVTEFAEAAATGAESVIGLVEAIVAAVRDRVVYESGSTDIGDSPAEVLAGGRGVCQDYAHLTIAALRAVGVPARYVSGYLFAQDETTLIDDGSDAVRVQTHAWVEAAIPGHGWWAVDPTNGGVVGERHVDIGHARDYGDVPPVRGVFVGDATASVDAEVVIAKLAPLVRTVTSDPIRRAGRGVPFAARAMQEAQQQ